MEEIEVSSWLTLDAIKKAADTVETVGNLQIGHSMSVFCTVEEDYLELCYSDSAANVLRRYEDRDELDVALERRKEEVGDAPFEEGKDIDKDSDGEDEDEGDDETGEGFQVEEADDI